MQPYLRDAVPADVPTLVALVRAGSSDPSGEHDGAGPTPAAYYDALAEIDRTPHSYLMVAEYGGEVLGMLQLIVFRHFQHRGRRCAEIESVFVAPAHRNSGLGSMLLEHAVARARELGCHRVQLTSNLRRDDAHRFYERHGFMHTHRGYRRQLT